MHKHSTAKYTASLLADDVHGMASKNGVFFVDGPPYNDSADNTRMCFLLIDKIASRPDGTELKDRAS
jgi:hypothetical protein